MIYQIRIPIACKGVIILYTHHKYMVTTIIALTISLAPIFVEVSNLQFHTTNHNIPLDTVNTLTPH